MDLRSFIGTLLQGDDKAQATGDSLEQLLGVYLDICTALAVTGPEDPRAALIARLLIERATDGPQDINRLRDETIATMRMA